MKSEKVITKLIIKTRIYFLGTMIHEMHKTQHKIMQHSKIIHNKQNIASSLSPPYTGCPNKYTDAVNENLSPCTDTKCGNLQVTPMHQSPTNVHGIWKEDVKCKMCYRFKQNKSKKVIQ